ncbi:hypothetical protein HT031_002924 [Scenedesmus sp. PABB004]|nr:hypothetical protein HT031_002924 [Scenedesmus sp. PABB004]
MRADTTAHDGEDAASKHGSSWREARLKVRAARRAAAAPPLLAAGAHGAHRRPAVPPSAQAALWDLLDDVSADECELAAARAELAQERACSRALAAERDEAAVELAAARAALEGAEEEAAALRAALDAERAALGAAERGRAEAEAELSECAEAAARRGAAALGAARAEAADVLRQQQVLLESLTQRDQQVAELSRELTAARGAAAAAARDAAALEGVARATGERAAAAEDELAAAQRRIVALQDEVAGLKDRLHAELAGLGELRAAAASAEQLRAGLVVGEASAAGRAAAREEGQRALGAAGAALAEAQARLAVLEAAGGARDALLAAAARDGDQSEPAAGGGAGAARLAALGLEARDALGAGQQLQALQAPLLNEGQGAPAGRALAATAAHDGGAQALAAAQQEAAELRLLLARREAEVQQLLAPEQQLLSGARIGAALLTQAWLRWRAASAAGRAAALSQQLQGAQAALQRHAELLGAAVDRGEAEARQLCAAAALTAWQRQAARQASATWAWRGLSEAALARAGAGSAGERVRGLLLRALHRRRCGDSGGGSACAAALAARRSLAVATGAWRAWARVEARRRQVEQAERQLEGLSSSLPVWVAQLGDRRRVERAWLGWRLAAVRARRAPAAASARARLAQPATGAAAAAGAALIAAAAGCGGGWAAAPPAHGGDGGAVQCEPPALGAASRHAAAAALEAVWRRLGGEQEQRPQPLEASNPVPASPLPEGQAQHPQKLSLRGRGRGGAAAEEATASSCGGGVRARGSAVPSRRPEGGSQARPRGAALSRAVEAAAPAPGSFARRDRSKAAGAALAELRAGVASLRRRPGAAAAGGSAQPAAGALGAAKVATTSAGEGAARAGATPLPSTVYRDLGTIRATLTAAQAGVDRSSRALFPAGAGASRSPGADGSPRRGARASQAMAGELQLHLQHLASSLAAAARPWELIGARDPGSGPGVASVNVAALLAAQQQRSGRPTARAQSGGAAPAPAAVDCPAVPSAAALEPLTGTSPQPGVVRFART